MWIAKRREQVRTHREKKKTDPEWIAKEHARQRAWREKSAADPK